MALTLFGIPNCDTVKKARAWLDGQGFTHLFHDFKKRGVPADQLGEWVQAVGWEALLNRRGTTFRGLSEDDKAHIDHAKAVELMLAHPSLIKRPVVVADDGKVTVGFSEAAYADTFAIAKQSQ